MTEVHALQDQVTSHKLPVHQPVESRSTTDLPSQPHVNQFELNRDTRLGVTRV